METDPGQTGGAKPEGQAGGQPEMQAGGQAEERPEPGTGTAALMEGALLASLTVVLALVVNMIPPLSLMAVAVPVPLVVAFVRRGARTALLVSVVATVLLMLFLPPLGGLLAGLSAAVLAFGLGIGMARRWPVEQVLAVGSAAALVVMVGGLALYGAVAGLGVAEGLMGILEESLVISREMLDGFSGAIGAEPEGAGLGAIDIGALIDTLRIMLPALLAAGAAVHAFVAYAITGAVLRRIGHETTALPAFRRWQLPVSAVYAYIIVRVAFMLAPETGAEGFLAVLLNLEVLLRLAFIVQGLAVAWFFLMRWRVNKVLAAAALIFGVLGPLTQYLIFLLGLVEPLLQVRYKYDDAVNRKDG